MGKGDHPRDKARAIPLTEYVERPIWCSEGGMHDVDPETDLCRKCERDPVHPDLPPGLDVQSAAS